MLDAIAETRSYISGMSYDQFCEDAKTLKAVMWNLTIIGEAARHIPPTVEAAYPEIPWPQIRGMRNRIVHGYEQIDWEIVWKAVQEELPPLVPLFEKILRIAPD
ncbi:MAG: DUF86 domain-containing protein [candidate division NC10 bacterium]|nr:DUF86 domain-containing protein [candidate division NC10 bacterium]MDE2322618.1 DUF86 domain-containing protein [candidate division NC10 bacterium]